MKKVFRKKVFLGSCKRKKRYCIFSE